jgi:hypothetical protein
MLIALMLKTQSLRQFNRKASADHRDARRAGKKPSYPRNRRPLR